MSRLIAIVFVAAMPAVALAEPMIIPQDCDSDQSYLFNDKFNPNWTGPVADNSAQETEQAAQSTQDDE